MTAPSWDSRTTRGHRRETGRSIEVRAPRIPRTPVPAAPRAGSRRAPRGWAPRGGSGSPAGRRGPRSARGRARASDPGTSRKSMDAVASVGMELVAFAPTPPPAIPRTLRAGRRIRSRSRAPSPSVRPSASSRARAASVSGASATARRLGFGQRPHVVGESGDEDAPFRVPHPRQQPCELDDRVGRPVPVVAAVEPAEPARTRSARGP